MNISRTRKLTTIGMLCALAYTAAVIGRVPMVLFLKYDPKDIIIAIAGFLFGPLTSLAVTVIVSVVQMFTVSATGVLGCIMNIVSSCCFACSAALFHKKHRRFSGAAKGVFAGAVCQAAVMMLWNYWITPIYMGCTREEVAELLLPAFLPFNVIKGALNAAGVLLLYKPIVTVLCRSVFRFDGNVERHK